MNKITQTLLGGAAFCALATAPAMAGDVPDLHAVALHPGHAKFVSKTSAHKGIASQQRSCITRSCLTTLSVFSTIPAELKTTVQLVNTFYTYYDSGSFCNSSEKIKVKLPNKKTQYAKLGTATETFSGYCSTAPTAFHGDTYELKSKSGEGKTDQFVSILVGKHIHYNHGVYNINTPMDVHVSIGQ